MRRLHTAFAAGFAVLPVLSFVRGGSGPSFTMYAASVEFRLELWGHDAEGGARPIAPTALVSLMPLSAKAAVAGSDHFRRTQDVAVLRRHAGDFARAACSLDPRFASVDITLFERSPASAAVTETKAHVECRP